MRYVASILLILASLPALAQQASVTGILGPYANGTVTEQASGNSATINGQGFFRIPVPSVPNHTFLFTSGNTTFGPFSVSVTIPTNGNTDISTQILAAMPIPNPFPVAALQVTTGRISINGVQYVWPSAQLTGCLVNDGVGNISWSSSCGTSGAGVTAVSIASANGITGSSSGGSTPALTIVLGNINPLSVTTGDTSRPTQWDFAPTTHASTVKAGTFSIGIDTVNTGYVFNPPTGPGTGFLYGSNTAGKVAHTYVNGFSGSCAPGTTLTVVNGIITGCS